MQVAVGAQIGNDDLIVLIEKPFPSIDKFEAPFGFVKREWRSGKKFAGLTVPQKLHFD